MNRPICAFLIVTLAASNPLFAASAREVERARQMSAAGAEAFRAKSWDEALAAFKEANALVPHPNLDVNIGRTYEALAQFDQAMIHCKIALNAPGVPEATRQAAQQCVERVQEQLKRPVVQVATRPPGAIVRVDGTIVGNTPWAGEVDPGRRQIDVELEGYKASSRALNAERGDLYPVEITLLTANIGGLLSVTSTPIGAFVFLDGDEIGPTPLRNFQVDARRYRLEVRAVGYAPKVSAITVEDGQALERAVTLVPHGGPVVDREPLPDWPGWVTVGLSGLSFGAGTLFGLEAMAAHDKADTIKRTGDPADPADVAAYKRHVADYDDAVLATNVFVIGGVLLLTGGLTWVLWPEPERPTQASEAADDGPPTPAGVPSDPSESDASD